MSGREPSWADAAGSAMWDLVLRHTGRVGYRRGAKSEGLGEAMPVIDCSGWVALLLRTGLQAANRTAGRALFDDGYRAALGTWSDRQIETIERRSGFVLPGDRIAPASLARFATIGLRQGGGPWSANHPRPRGITHVVQVVRRPGDGEPFVSESQGMHAPFGVGLTPLALWIASSRGHLASGEAWAVDAFRSHAADISIDSCISDS